MLEQECFGARKIYGCNLKAVCLGAVTSTSANTDLSCADRLEITQQVNKDSGFLTVKKH